MSINDDTQEVISLINEVGCLLGRSRTPLRYVEDNLERWSRMSTLITSGNVECHKILGVYVWMCNRFCYHREVLEQMHQLLHTHIIPGLTQFDGDDDNSLINVLTFWCIGRCATSKTLNEASPVSFFGDIGNSLLVTRFGLRPIEILTQINCWRSITNLNVEEYEFLYTPWRENYNAYRNTLYLRITDHMINDLANIVMDYLGHTCE